MPIFKSSKYTVFLAGTCLASLSMPAMAQADKVGASSANIIIVTANKREENLQDVPVAISVIGTEQLEVAGFDDVRDLSGLAPNLTVNPGANNPTATVVGIRGISAGGDESLTSDQSIALYIDGIYLGRAAASVIFSKDVEAVEVLRGPQGTLSGRNSTGGAVRFRMRRPTEEFGVDVEAGYGNQDSREALARLNSGNLFDDNVRFSLTYAHSQNDGYVDNLLTQGNDRDPGANNVDSFRVAMEADLGDTGSIYYSFDYSDFVTHSQAFQTTIANPTVTGFLANSTTTAGCSLEIVPTRQDALCLDDDFATESEIYGHVFKMENDFGGVTVRSTTGFRSWRSFQQNADLDGFGPITGPAFSNATLFNGITPAALLIPFTGSAAAANFVSATPVPNITTSLFATGNKRKQDQISQEIEVLSNSSGPFNWVIGAFYFYEKSKENNRQDAGFPLDVDQILRFNPNFGAAGPLLADGLAPGTRYRVIENSSNVTYTTSGESIALYGQGEYRFGENEDLGVTLGLRYTWDEKKINQTSPFTNVGTVNFSEPTGHLTIDYRFSDDVNIYAKAARGYRSGGFNIRTQQDPFDPEILWSYEAGVKTQFWDNRIRFNLAGFYAEYTDQQISQPVTNPGGGGFGVLTVNAGKTQYKGVEAELSIEPFDGLQFNGSFGYVDREFKEYPLALADGTVIDIADQVISKTYSPSTSASGSAQYTHYFANEMFLLTRVAATYEGSRFFFTAPQTSPFARDLKARARTLVDAQIRLGDIPLAGDSKGFVQLWGKNIFDKEYETRAIDFGALGYGGFYYGRPATYGVTAGVSF
ncbi:TonB-dependent receptor [Parasphingorhabdus sp. JC815]|uniref:TonB-dependent receptor n=1 Tax=Parasphingorhabdus sp. JC815 TaxID=3232140 RepID=UPI003459080B